MFADLVMHPEKGAPTSFLEILLQLPKGSNSVPFDKPDKLLILFSGVVVCIERHISCFTGPISLLLLGKIKNRPMSNFCNSLIMLLSFPIANIGQHLIPWTDGDRKGENIADEIVHHGGRLYFEIAPEAIIGLRVDFNLQLHLISMRACGKLQ